MKVEKTVKYFIDEKKGIISVCTSKGWVTLPIDNKAFMEAMEGWGRAVVQIGKPHNTEEPPKAQGVNPSYMIVDDMEIGEKLLTKTLKDE